MAYNKRTWLGRQGTGLNKFSIGGASPVTIVNQPDSVTQVGDALSAGNLNDLEDRIEDAFDETASQTEVSNLNNALTAIDHRVQNLEQAHGSYEVKPYKDGSTTPSGKGDWAVVEGVRGVSRVENQMIPDAEIHQQVTSSDTSWHFTSPDNYNLPLVNGHKYLFIVTGTAIMPTWGLRENGGSQLQPSVNANNLFDCTETGTYGLRYKGDGQSTYDCYIYFKDLTLYFGGTIPSDADTIAKIQTNYPHLLQPSDYGVRIVDSSYSGVRAWSPNLLNLNRSTIITSAESQVKRDFTEDQAWVGITVNDYFNNANVTSYSIGLDSVTVNSINAGYGVGFPVKCVPSTAYYMGQTSAYNLGVGYFDADGYFLSYDLSAFTAKTFTTPANCYWMLIVFRPAINVSSTYTNPMLNIGSTALTYSRYFVNTLSLTFTGKSAGSVYDSCEPNVEVNGVARKRTTERVKSYTFTGNETWTYVTTYDYPVFYCAIFTDALYAYNLDLTVLSDTYVPITNRDYYAFRNNDLNKMCCFINNQGFPMFAIQDTAITSGSDMASHMAGKTIRYALAEDIVTLSDPIIDNTLLTEAGGRMATVQTGTVVDGSFDMGFITL